MIQTKADDWNYDPLCNKNHRENIFSVVFIAERIIVPVVCFSLNHLLLRLISTLLKLEISTLLKTITNSCFQALEGLKFQALEGLKFQDLCGWHVNRKDVTK